MFESQIDFNLKNLNAVVVAVKNPQQTDSEFQLSLSEIHQLSVTLGVHLYGDFVQKRITPDSAYYIGKGKIEEIISYINSLEQDIDVIIFDNDISGVQERNLEKVFGRKILDRTSIILHIFNKRARSNEAKLQVELATIEYMLPRLKHLWTHFSRSEGIVGIRGGEGEKQLELDRRMIKQRIISIKSKLKKIDTQSETRRKKRQGVFNVSLVGYTNAGKSSLMNLLSKSELQAESLMFSTIDSTIRKVYINDELTILLNDTVGFINKLPHSLVASFKSTLDEIKSSNLILHVIDCSTDHLFTHIQSVATVLNEINAESIPVIRIFNKCDLLENQITGPGNFLKKDDVLLSTYTREGVDILKEKITHFFEKGYL